MQLRKAGFQMSLTLKPLSLPTDWPTPNYVDPITRGGGAFFIVTSAITSIVVALRLYSRYFLLRSVGIDDALLLAGHVGRTHPCLSAANIARYCPLVRHLQNTRP